MSHVCPHVRLGFLVSLLSSLWSAYTECVNLKTRPDHISLISPKEQFLFSMVYITMTTVLPFCLHFWMKYDPDGSWQVLRDSHCIWHCWSSKETFRRSSFLYMFWDLPEVRCTSRSSLFLSHCFSPAEKQTLNIYCIHKHLTQVKQQNKR